MDRSSQRVGYFRTARKLSLRAAVAVLAACMFLLPGRAPGTVNEQRARLPPPAKCEDNEIEGVWKSHAYNKRYREWTEFTLEIREVPGKKGHLQGRVLNHSWKGVPKQEQPGPCRGLLRYRVSMPAKGTYKNHRVSFYGTSWKMDNLLCGSSWGFHYNLDHFTGEIDFERQEFQSVNNDGGRSVNEPTVFRRIKCFDKNEKPPDPSITIKPPPLFPEKASTGGGGCN